jgi:hypothetical protein
MIEGSISVPLTNGSGSGPRRPKNIRIRIWIRIRNIDLYLFAGIGSKSDSATESAVWSATGGGRATASPSTSAPFQNGWNGTRSQSGWNGARPQSGWNGAPWTAADLAPAPRAIPPSFSYQVRKENKIWNGVLSNVWNEVSFLYSNKILTDLINSDPQYWAKVLLCAK